MSCSTAEWLEKGNWFNYRNHRIFYIMEGTGEPLILLHGFPTSSWDWHKVWDSLVSSYTVIAFDFIGFGFSDKPLTYAYSVKDQADLAEQLLAHLNISSYHILAHDFGDTVAQELLARQIDHRSDRVRSCCFLNGGLFPETHRATGTQKLLLSPLGFLVARMLTFKRFVNAFTLLFPAETQPSHEELENLYSIVTHNNGKRIAHKLIRYITERKQHRERWVGALQKTSCPLMLIDGLDDPVSGAHMAAHYREIVPQPRVIEISGAGHYPQMEIPDQVIFHYTVFRTKTNPH